jgi:hypothetical protein
MFATLSLFALRDCLCIPCSPLPADIALHLSYHFNRQWLQGENYPLDRSLEALPVCLTHSFHWNLYTIAGVLSKV